MEWREQCANAKETVREGAEKITKISIRPPSTIHHDPIGKYPSTADRAQHLVASVGFARGQRLPLNGHELRLGLDHVRGIRER